MSLNEYIYGVQCGDSDCYACGTQRYNCDELNRLDDEEDKSSEPTDKELSEIEADLEAQDWDIFGEDSI